MWFSKKKPELLFIPLEEQLQELAQIGLTLTNGHFPERMSAAERLLYEQRPYILLLIAMGKAQLTADGIAVHPSGSAWCFDPVCITRSGDLSRKLQRIAEIVKDEIQITDISDELDAANQKGRVRFAVNGQTIELELDILNHRMRFNLFGVVSKLLMEHGSGKRFYFSFVGDEVLFVFIEKRHFDYLNKLLNIFIPAYLGEGNS